MRREIVDLDTVQLSLAERLLMRALSLTPYAPGALEALEAAARSPGVECCSLASVRNGAIDGVIVFGTFAGAAGAGRLHLVVVGEASRREGIGGSLVEAAVARLTAAGARFLLAELPDDSRALPHAREFLSSLGFSEDGRVENFFRDGVSLAFLRLDLANER